VVSEDVLEGALRTAWKLRIEKNAKAGKKSSVKRLPLVRAHTAPKKNNLRKGDKSGG
jgi:hypothetical protein